MENKWIKQGNNFKVTPSSISVENELPVAIYSINYNGMTGEFSLNYIADKFEFDFELLPLEQKFIDHAIKTYEATTGNFGILLNGTKGCGKSITAKILANTLNKPVIIVDTAYKGIDSFLASLNFECILFFDEFEKNFDPKLDINILTIMDGVYNCCKRKVFILTTNDLRINSCLLSRPSRIRYKKEYSNISSEVINHLFDKLLKDQSIRDTLFTYVTSLEVCSVDIIKALITELNIHGKENFDYIKEIFNVKANPVSYNVYVVLGQYWDYDDNSWHFRSKEEALKTLATYQALKEKPQRTKEEQTLYNKLDDSGCMYEYGEPFPCRIWDLKKGMYLMGHPIVEVLEDLRIIVTQDTKNVLRYIYACPTYAYNAYNGNVLLLRF